MNAPATSIALAGAGFGWQALLGAERLYLPVARTICATEPRRARTAREEARGVRVTLGSRP